MENNKRTEIIIKWASGEVQNYLLGRESTYFRMEVKHPSLVPAITVEHLDPTDEVN